MNEISSRINVCNWMGCPKGFTEPADLYAHLMATHFEKTIFDEQCRVEGGRWDDWRRVHDTEYSFVTDSLVDAIPDSIENPGTPDSPMQDQTRLITPEPLYKTPPSAATFTGFSSLDTPLRSQDTQPSPEPSPDLSVLVRRSSTAPAFSPSPAPDPPHQPVPTLSSSTGTGPTQASYLTGAQEPETAQESNTLQSQSPSPAPQPPRQSRRLRSNSRAESPAQPELVHSAPRRSSRRPSVSSASQEKPVSKARARSRSTSRPPSSSGRNSRGKNKPLPVVEKIVEVDEAMLSPGSASPLGTGATQEQTSPSLRTPNARPRFRTGRIVRNSQAADTQGAATVSPVQLLTQAPYDFSSQDSALPDVDQ
ncbi:hypothetical protein BDW22DRAFT_1094909 [Trametopsis cervina]|nr:hypothetical protein BDW22DRAFT_1094909 [Trametopsis cervina]